MPRLDGSRPGASRQTADAFAGPSAASIMTRRFGTLFAARRGCCLATVGPYEVRRGRTVRASQQTRSAHVRFGVISCRDGTNLWCPLYPRKLPRQSTTGAAVKGHERTFQPIRFLADTGRHRSEQFRSDTEQSLRVEIVQVISWSAECGSIRPFDKGSDISVLSPYFSSSRRHCAGVLPTFKQFGDRGSDFRAGGRVG